MVCNSALYIFFLSFIFFDGAYSTQGPCPPVPTPKSPPMTTPNPSPKSPPVTTPKSPPMPTPKPSPKSPPVTTPKSPPMTTPKPSPKSPPVTTPKSPLMPTPKPSPKSPPVTTPKSPPMTTPKPSPKSPPVTTPKSPPNSPTCPQNTLKWGACVDLLAGLVHLVEGAVSSSKCCSLVKGVSDLEAAVCLCTTIKGNVSATKIDVPVAFTLLITACGKKIPPGYKCA